VSGSSSITIPFTLVQDHVFISVTVNGTGPYRFLVDTGGVNLIDTTLVKALRLGISGSETGHGIGPQTVESEKTKIDELKTGTGTFKTLKFYTFDFNRIDAKGGIKGMIGASMFRRYVTCFDFQHQVIELIDPARFDFRDGGSPLRMSVKDSEITVKGDFDGMPGKFQIDTGSASTLELNSPFVARYKLLSKFPKRVESLNSGVGGSSQAFTVRGASLALGAAQISGPITYSPSLRMDRKQLATTMEGSGIVR
jgi:hypothetical protein